MLVVAGYFYCVKINVFRSFFVFRLEMHIRCDNQYKNGADRGDILGGEIFCRGCLSAWVSAHENEIRSCLV